MSGILRAIIIIVALPAILYVIGILQDYCTANLTLNTYEQLFMDALPFITVVLYIFGVFKAISRMHGEE